MPIASSLLKLISQTTPAVRHQPAALPPAPQLLVWDGVNERNITRCPSIQAVKRQCQKRRRRRQRGCPHYHDNVKYIYIHMQLVGSLCIYQHRYIHTRMYINTRICPRYGRWCQHTGLFSASQVYWLYYFTLLTAFFLLQLLLLSIFTSQHMAYYVAYG